MAREYIVFLWSFVSLSACAPIVVYTEMPDYPDSASEHAAMSVLESAKTYTWIPKPPDDPATELVPGFRHRLRKAIDTALSDKGYVRLRTGPADLQVVYYAHVDHEERTWVTTWGYTYRPWRDRWGYTWGPALTHWQPVMAVERYGVGTLVIDIVDPKTEQLLWRGWTRDAAYLHSPETRLLKAARKIIGELPTAASEPSAESGGG